MSARIYDIQPQVALTSDEHRRLYRTALRHALEWGRDTAALTALATEIRLGRALLVDPPVRGKSKPVGGAK